MTDIHHIVVAAAPVEATFDYVDDYRNVPHWLHGITRFDPAGDQDQGLGAIYHADMRIGPKIIGSVVEITAWERNHLLELTSIEGFSTRSRWQFEALGENETRLTIDFRYTVPGGIAGRILGKIIEPFAEQAIHHSDTALCRLVEEKSQHS